MIEIFLRYEDWMQFREEDLLEDEERSASPRSRSISASKGPLETMKSKVLKEMEQRIQEQITEALVFGGDENLINFQQNANGIVMFYFPSSFDI